jgi:CBS domain-containing protein/anti-sigma regulatory factor (Ser/Thr protein kinase)
VVSDKQVTRVQELTYELKVENVMTTNVISIGLKDNMATLRELLRAHSISGVPVTEGNRLVGLISIEDLIKCLADGQMSALVEDKMTRKVETLFPDEMLAQAISKFNRTGFGRFPVVDRSRGRLVGIMTKGDIVRYALKKLESEFHQEELRRATGSHIFQDIAADVACLELEYYVKSRDFSRAGEATDRLKKTLLRLGFHPQVVRRVAIAAYEAEMNIVIYTPGGHLSVRLEPGLIRLDARDTGPGIADIEQAMQPGFSTAPEWVREMGFGAGMGLPNIKKCADTMVLTSELNKGTEVTAIFRTSRDHA